MGAYQNDCELPVGIVCAELAGRFHFVYLVIVVAIKETGQFSYLDTLISETNETFRIVVGANIVKAGVENIFKYNDFGGKGSRYMGTSNSENENIENVEDNRG